MSAAPSIVGEHTRIGPHLRKIVSHHYCPDTPLWRKFCWRRDAIRRAVVRYGMNREQSIAGLVAVGQKRAEAVALTGTWPELIA
jgi:hypothetical protein